MFLLDKTEMTWNGILTSQHADALDSVVERGAAASAGNAMLVVKLAWPVDADADSDVPPAKQLAPLWRDQRTVRLERMVQSQRGRPQRLDSLKDRS